MTKDKSVQFFEKKTQSKLALKLVAHPPKKKPASPTPKKNKKPSPVLKNKSPSLSGNAVPSHKKKCGAVFGGVPAPKALTTCGKKEVPFTASWYDGKEWKTFNDKVYGSNTEWNANWKVYYKPEMFDGSGSHRRRRVYRYTKMAKELEGAYSSRMSQYGPAIGKVIKVKCNKPCTVYVAGDKTQYHASNGGFTGGSGWTKAGWITLDYYWKKKGDFTIWKKKITTPNKAETLFTTSKKWYGNIYAQPEKKDDFEAWWSNKDNCKPGGLCPSSKVEFFPMSEIAEPGMHSWGDRSYHFQQLAPILHRALYSYGGTWGPHKCTEIRVKCTKDCFVAVAVEAPGHGYKKVGYGNGGFTGGSFGINVGCICGLQSFLVHDHVSRGTGSPSPHGWGSQRVPDANSRSWGGSRVGEDFCSPIRGAAENRNSAFFTSGRQLPPQSPRALR